jgi:hypothetical protein
MALSETWFMEGYIDFELQKYRLLAYLQEVKKCFGETKLYPQLSDIVQHYNDLLEFRNNKRFLQDQFPRKLASVNIQRLELVYEQMLADDTLMLELEQIAVYALDQMKSVITEGADIYDFVEQQLQIEPVGIVPLYKNEGYVLIRYQSLTEVRVYSYTVTLLEHKNARYRGIRLNFIDTRTKNMANTYEQIKLGIIRDIRTLPNPAVYKIEFPMDVPYHETLLPIAKRALVKEIV